MNSDLLRIVFGLFLLAGLGMGVGACDHHHADSDAEDVIEDAADDTGDAAEDVGDDVEDALD